MSSVDLEIGAAAAGAGDPAGLTRVERPSDEEEISAPALRRPAYVIGFVAGEQVATRHHLCALDLVTRDRAQVLAVVAGPTLHWSRNRLVELFLANYAEDVLLLTDTDMVFTLADADALLTADMPFVAGPYVDGFGNEVRGIGFAAVRRRVLEAVGPNPFNPVQLEDGTMTAEDVAFLIRARHAGFPLEVVEGLSIGHAKTMTLYRDRPANAGVDPIR